MVIDLFGNVYYSAMDDIPHADETRTLIKDIWDIRISKLRSSIDTFVKSEATHAKVSRQVTQIQNKGYSIGFSSCVEFGCPFNSVGSCGALSVYLTILSLGRLSPLSG